MKNKLLLMIALGLSVACSGKSLIPPNPEPVASANVYEIYETKRNDGVLTQVVAQRVIPSDGTEVLYSLFLQGHPTLPIGNQKMLLRTVEDFAFWYQFVTGRAHSNPSVVMDTNDVILIVNYRTQWYYYFVMERAYLVDGVLNIYYSYRADHEGEQGIVDFKFYQVDKTDGSFNFIEVE